MLLAGLFVGFQMNVYVVDEGIISIQICVETSGSGSPARNIALLEITTQSVTASSKIISSVE